MVVSSRDPELTTLEHQHLGPLDSESGTTVKLPSYDKARRTHVLLIIAFILICLISVFAIGFGIYTAIPSSKFWYPGKERNPIPFWPVLLFPTTNSKLMTIITLGLQLLVAVCTEILGYIHTTSLRWTLAREDRLFFNSNLRLFSVAKSSAANGKLANIVMIIAMALCYGSASSVLFLIDGHDPISYSLVYVYLNPVPLLLLGTGLMIGAIVTAIGWSTGVTSGRIKSWNSNPLNTALACLHHGMLIRRNGRMIASSSERTLVELPQRQRLKKQQPSAQISYKPITYITRFLIATSLLLLIVGCVILGLSVADAPRHPGGIAWTFFPTFDGLEGYPSSWLLEFPLDIPNLWPAPFIALAWNVGWQSISTVVLHMAELLINIHRDEGCWRAAYIYRRNPNRKGAKFEQNALKAAFSSKGSVLLFSFKPLAQWLYSLGFYSIDFTGLGVNALPLLTLVGLMGLFTIAMCLIARHKPKGPQPSTYGHLQTLVDLIDDWGDGAEGNLYWGDKSSRDSVPSGLNMRRVGTSSRKDGVRAIRMDLSYCP